ncbi:MAG: PAS domain-containing protein [Nitrospirae bacterium]|nr:PAS domain-containing protein [Nitrospirota bacterium]
MPHSEPIIILLISEHAEVVKTLTLNLRGLFAGCNIEAVYSADEARTWTSAREWTFILIDDECLDSAPSLPGELKGRAPYAAIILYSDRIESPSALRARQAGIDCVLSKQSPVFLTELLSCATQAIETGRLRAALDHAQERQRRLIESCNDIVYELDPAGRFVALSSSITPLLGYSPDELIGLPYTALLPPDQQSAAQHHVNERRSDARSSSCTELIFSAKSTQNSGPRRLTVEVSAKGLYGPLHRFLGTVGWIRGRSLSTQQDRTIEQLRRQLQQADERLALAQRVARLSRQLQGPLASLLTESQRLFATTRDTSLQGQFETLAGHAVQAATLDAQLTHALEDMERSAPGLTINDVLDDLLTSATPPIVDGSGLLRKLSPHLTHLVGDREQITTLVRHLLHYAQTYLLTVGRAHQLILSTNVAGPPATSADSLSLAPSTAVEIELLESDLVRPAGSATTLPQPLDLLTFDQLTRQLGGSLDLSAPSGGPFRMLLRLPGASRPPREIRPLPVAVPATPPTPEPATKNEATAPAPSTDASSPQQERRQTARVPTTLPAAIIIGAATWNGTLSNIGLGGACVTFPCDVPTLSPQEAHVAFKTAVGNLALHGRAQMRPLSLHTETEAAQLIVTFEPPRHAEGAVRALLVQAAQKHTMPFSLELRLTAEQPPVLPAASQLKTTEEGDYSPREAIRVAVQLPARLHVRDASGRSHHLDAWTTNLSRNGACLHLNARPELLSGMATLHFAATQSQNHPGTHDPSALDATLPARLIWSAPDPTTPGELSPPASDPALQVGVQFQDSTPYAEREVNRVVRQHLTALSEPDLSSQQTSIVSLPRECHNPRSQTIVISEDHLRPALPPDAPVIVIAPGYGQTAVDAMMLSYYLAHHRLRVLRYDHTNHVGLSDGELRQTTLRNMQDDLLTVVEFARHMWPSAPLIVMASDLTARVALKMAGQSRPLDLLLLINPVVDVQALLATVYRHDLVADHRKGVQRGIANLLGLNVNLDHFIDDIEVGHFTDQASTIVDLRLLHTPSAILTVPHSPLGPWPPASLPQAFLAELGPQISLVPISAPLIGQDFPLNEPHSPAFRQVLEQIAATIVLPATPAELNEHTSHALRHQQRIEMEQARLRHNPSHLTREALWFAHLHQLPQLEHLHEYEKLLDDLYQLLSPLEPGSRLMDVEVGLGDFVQATLIQEADRSRQRGGSPAHPIHMIGVGRSLDSLTQARHSLRALQRKLDSGVASPLTSPLPLAAEWVHANWTESLPFKNDSLHRIACNLSLPFVPSPLAAVRELYRVLHPQGRLVLTVFHPATDLSVLYRRHLQRTNQNDFSPEAEILLHYLGELREAIRQGLLHIFDQQSLTSLLLRAGDVTPTILPTLDGQALLAIIEKDKSAG